MLMMFLGGPWFVRTATQTREPMQDKAGRTARAMKQRGAANQIQWLNVKCRDVRSSEQIELLITGKAGRWLKGRVLSA